MAEYTDNPDTNSEEQIEQEVEQTRLAGFVYNKFDDAERAIRRSEDTSELQSHHDLVCRLLLEKKKHQK